MVFVKQDFQRFKDTMQGQKLLKAQFVALVSNDEQEFYVDQKVAKLSEVISQKLRSASLEGGAHPRIVFEDIRGSVLEIVLQYLHYKSKHINTFKQYLPEFYINPDLALEVVRASLALGI